MLQISCWLDALSEPLSKKKKNKKTTPYYNTILLAWLFEHFGGGSGSSTLITFESNTWNFVRKTYRRSTKINVKEISGQGREGTEWNGSEKQNAGNGKVAGDADGRCCWQSQSVAWP